MNHHGLSESRFRSLSDYFGCLQSCCCSFIPFTVIFEEGFAARFVRYEPLTIPEIVVGSANEVVLEVTLEEQISQLEEVVVKSKVRKDRPGNNIRVKPTI